MGAGGPAVAGGLGPSPAVAPAEDKKVKANKEESEESVDDMDFGFFWLNLFGNMFNKKLSSLLEEKKKDSCMH